MELLVGSQQRLNACPPLPLNEITAPKQKIEELSFQAAFLFYPSPH